MKKYLAMFFLATVVIIFSGCQDKPKDTAEVAKDDSSIIFFYGRECPHCKNVEKYFEENKVSEKVQFSQREVYHDTANANLMFEKAAGCGITDKGSLGVPMLWAEGKCLFGEVDIRSYFEEKIK